MTGDAAAPAGIWAHKGWYSRGYLPHFDSREVVQAVVFRLGDSVPQSLLARWREDARLGIGAPLRERFAAFEDTGYGARHLARPEVAETVQDALLHFDGARYRLLEWCVMPNYVHVLAAQTPGHKLSDVVH